jgi:hypothetical protein
MTKGNDARQSTTIMLSDTTLRKESLVSTIGVEIHAVMRAFSINHSPIHQFTNPPIFLHVISTQIKPISYRSKWTCVNRS